MQSTLRLPTDPLVYSHFQTLRKRWGSPTEDKQTSLRKLSLSFLGLVFVLFFPNQVIAWAIFLDLLNPQPVDA